MSIGTIAIAGLIVLIVLTILTFLLGGSDESSTESKRTRSASSSRSRSVTGGGSKGRNTSSAGDVQRHWLLGRSDEVRDKSYHVGTRRVSVGRKPSNFIQIPGQEASRSHFQLNGSPEGLEIIDMNSENGTFVNGEELSNSESRMLQDGDVVEAGDVEYVYQARGDYRENSALNETKSAGPKEVKSTKAAGSIEQQLEAALEETGGDLEEAADIVGLDPAIAEKLLQ